MEHVIQIFLVTFGICGWGLFFWKHLQTVRISAKYANLEEKLIAVTTDLVVAKEQVHQYTKQLEEQRSQNLCLTIEKATFEERTRVLTHEQNQKKVEIEALKQSIIKDLSAATNQFILEKAAEIGKLSKNEVEPLLSQVFKEIDERKKSIEAELKAEKQEVINLKTAVKTLSENTTKFAKNADEVITTLRGSNRHQGTWVEQMLENLLTSSGLRPGHEYVVQDHIDNEFSGGRKRPDVLINLPDNKFIIIDAKAQVDAWDNYCQLSDIADRENAAKALTQSFKAHIKNLSSKAYFEGFPGQTAEFVLMFVPFEAAYLVALEHDKTLFDFSWSKNVIIVGPTNLFATLKMIYLMWKFVSSEQDVEKILKSLNGLLKQAGAVLECIEDGQKRLNGVQKAFDDATTKLTGRQGIIPAIKRLQQVDDGENFVTETIAGAAIKGIAPKVEVVEIVSDGLPF